jgi:hypothetical protein
MSAIAALQSGERDKRRSVSRRIVNGLHVPGAGRHLHLLGTPFNELRHSSPGGTRREHSR